MSLQDGRLCETNDIHGNTGTGSGLIFRPAIRPDSEVPVLTRPVRRMSDDDDDDEKHSKYLAVGQSSSKEIVVIRLRPVLLCPLVSH